MKDKRKTFKYWVGKLHLWLGLGSGIIVFIIAITGCIYAFETEIQNMIQPYRFVEAKAAPMLQPSELKAIGQRTLPGKKMHAVIYTKPGNAARIVYYNFDPEYYYLAYVNPYSGEVLEVRNEYASFFRFILDGHFYLWLPPAVGQPVVASATLIFLVMMISGLVLWWPKNKGATKQRFTVKWNARWRRKNYDLHNVLGFYCTWIAIILAVTGLVWGFQWFAQGLYTVAGGEKSLVYSDPGSDTTALYASDVPAMDKLYNLMKSENPEAAMIEVHIPETTASSLEIAVNPDAGTYWQTDYRYFDQYTLKELSVPHIYGRSKETAAADKLLRMNYDIHTGAIIGLPGKIIAFFASLIVASLPVTGFYIWWGRRKKEKAALPHLERPAEKFKNLNVATASKKPVPEAMNRYL